MVDRIISSKVNPIVYKRLRLAAVEADSNVSEYIRELIEDALAQQGSLDKATEGGLSKNMKLTT